MSAARCLTSRVAYAFALAVPCTPAAAQAVDTPAAARALAERIGRVGAGFVTFGYAVRAGVCGDGAEGVSVGDGPGAFRVRRWRGSDGGTWNACEPGPARVTIDVRGGVPRLVQLAVGGRAGAATVPEHTVPSLPGDRRALGMVAGAVAAAYLLDVAAHAEGETGERAVLAAAVADSAVIWPELLRLARNTEASTGARRAAAFWAGQNACDAVRARAPRPVAADTADRDVRRQIVFALSQRATDERLPTLVRLARSDRDPEVRCSALFWLGQMGAAGDAPALASGALTLYEDVLRTR